MGLCQKKGGLTLCGNSSAEGSRHSRGESARPTFIAAPNQPIRLVSGTAKTPVVTGNIRSRSREFWGLVVAWVYQV